MLELPEAYTVSSQLKHVLTGKTVASVTRGAPHSLAFFSGDADAYSALLTGRTVTDSSYFGGQVDISFGNVSLVLNDGVNIRYYEPGAALPGKYQMLIALSPGGAIVFSVQMYGGLPAFERGTYGNFYYNAARERPSPLSANFDESYFSSLLTAESRKLSAKAFLATEQRIPGLGNGTLQDILWQCGIHPRCKMSSLDDTELERMYTAVKTGLADMAERGGRDTERDIYGNPGGYQTVMSKKNDGRPCPRCGGTITRSAYLGGNVYTCDSCQRK